MRPIAGDALAHGALKGPERSCPDTGFRVRGNIRPIDDPERRVYSIPASEWLSAGARVTRRTVSGRGQSFSLSNRPGREALWDWAAYEANLRPP